MVYQNGKSIAMSFASSGGYYQEIYSTEEQVIGRWIDGKPLYRKVFVGTTPTHERLGDSVVVIPFQDIIGVVSLEGIVYQNDYVYVPLNKPSVIDGNTTAFAFFVNGEGIRMLIETDIYANVPVHFILEYTKVADPVSTTFSDISKVEVCTPTFVQASASFAKELSTN